MLFPLRNFEFSQPLSHWPRWFCDCRVCSVKQCLKNNWNFKLTGLITENNQSTWKYMLDSLKWNLPCPAKLVTACHIWGILGGTELAWQTPSHHQAPPHWWLWSSSSLRNPGGMVVVLPWWPSLKDWVGYGDEILSWIAKGFVIHVIFLILEKILPTAQFYFRLPQFYHRIAISVHRWIWP